MPKAKKVKKTAKKMRLKKMRRPAKKQPKKAKVKKMLKSELKKFKALLLAERSRIMGGLSHIAENTLNKSQRDASGDLSGYSYHMADMASDDYERDFSLGRATEDQEILYAIDEALKRIEEGAYGNCLDCGKAIAKKRLLALPYASVCIECQKKNDTK